MSQDAKTGNPTHSVKALLSQQRSRWIQQWRWVIVLASIFCWLPAVFVGIILFDGYAMASGMPSVSSKLGYSFVLIGGIVIGMGYLAQPISTLATSFSCAKSLRIPDEILISDSDNECYRTFRQTVRSFAYRFSIILVLAPALAMYLVAAFPFDLFITGTANFSNMHSTELFGIILVVSMSWATFTEVIQFVALRFMQTHLLLQILLGALIFAPQVVFITVAPQLGQLLGYSEDNFTLTFVVPTVTALLLAVCLSYATKSVTRNFTETLSARNLSKS